MKSNLFPIWKALRALWVLLEKKKTTTQQSKKENTKTAKK